jgi:molybdopterin molybdotransferase
MDTQTQSVESPPGPATPSDLLAVDDARARILAAVPTMDVERIPLAHAVGRVLAEDVAALVSHPPAPVSAMDGYACRSADVVSLPARLHKIGVSKAGAGFDGTLAPGECVRIFTGARVLDGADVIALQEDAVEHDGMVEIAEVPRPGQFIRPAGQDFAAGQLCVAAGRALTARDISLIASCGNSAVAVRRKPRIAILSTGDELLAPGSPLSGPDRIMASNGLALAAAVTQWGGEPLDLGIAPDQVDAIAAAIDAAAGADMLVTTGGASVGDHDLVLTALVTRGFTTDFHKIAMRPGKPLMFGLLGAMPVLGMPGNPVSALVCGLLFLRPAMRAMLGLADTQPRFARAVLAAPMPENDRREDYVRARLATDPQGRRVAEPFSRQDSGMAMTLARADGLIRRLPVASAARAGDQVEIIDFACCDGF